MVSTNGGTSSSCNCLRKIIKATPKRDVRISSVIDKRKRMGWTRSLRSFIRTIGRISPHSLLIGYKGPNRISVPTAIGHLIKVLVKVTQFIHLKYKVMRINQTIGIDISKLKFDVRIHSNQMFSVFTNNVNKKINKKVLF